MVALSTVFEFVRNNVSNHEPINIPIDNELIFPVFIAIGIIIGILAILSNFTQKK